MNQQVLAENSTGSFLPASRQAIAELFRSAVQFHCQGKLYEAERGYRKVLSLEPDQAGSLHGLGLIGHQTGHNAAAEDLIRRAIARDGKKADYHCNLGSVLEALGRTQEAETSYRRALALAPGHTQARNNLGNALLAEGRTEEAIGQYALVLAQHPEDADVLNNLGSALERQGKLEEAVACFEKAVAINGRHDKAYYNLGRTHQELGNLDLAEKCYRQALSLQPGNARTANNLGNVCAATGKAQEAEACYQRAIDLDRNYAEAYNNLGNLLREQERAEEAFACYAKALELKPDYTEAAIHCGDTLQNAGKLHEAMRMYEAVLAAEADNGRVHRNLGEALRKLGRWEEAVAHCRRACALDASDADAETNLGNALYDAGKAEEAIGCFERSLKLRPEHAITHVNLAVAHLMRGEFAEGWKEYEWRKRLKAGTEYRRGFSQPLWRGEPLAGKRILLSCEQGLGDSLQFLRYIPLVQAAGGRVILEAPPRLERLAQQLPGLEEITRQGEPLPGFDWHCPLLSLPLIFHTDLTSIPSTVPYLSAPEEAQQKAWNYAWPKARLHVGIAWAGNAKNPNNRFRSIPLAAFEKVFATRGVKFFSLQIGTAVEEIAQSGAPVADLEPLTEDMADTAAFVNELDLVITVDTAIAHLAGALGKPVWILLPANADWRWLEDRTDTPWYPTARLFRQKQPDDWKETMELIAGELDELAQRD